MHTYAVSVGRTVTGTIWVQVGLPYTSEHIEYVLLRALFSIGPSRPFRSELRSWEEIRVPFETLTEEEQGKVWMMFLGE